MANLDDFQASENLAARVRLFAASLSSEQLTQFCDLTSEYTAEAIVWAFRVAAAGSESSR